ncbi:MAG: 3-keto-5-aminohexanoate cleavage protein [Solirubrobacterales bacterium]|nr:3-keto-5-aminohexanoate cleavage protein [Solirubrobacterales bacterium]
MIQCALNGAYGHGDHPAVPETREALVADAAACAAAGAGSVHMHPRRPGDQRETLAADVHDATVRAIRDAAPGLEISCSTRENIDLGGAVDRVAAIGAWTEPPDVVSLNVSEAGMLELGRALIERGIGIEAGVWTLSDAAALLEADWAHQVHRVLVEAIFEHDDAAAVQLARAIDARVALLGRPRLWHGDGRANWAVVDAGLADDVDIRVGLEDTLFARDGGPAPDNAGQVAEMAAMVALRPGADRPPSRGDR